MKRNDSTASTTRVVQGDLYEAAGQPGFAFEIPAPYRAEHFEAVAEELGINAAAFARANNQWLAENLGNNMSSRVKKAANDNTTLPTQDDMQALYDNYDYTGSRGGSVSFGSPFERILYRMAGNFIRKLLKKSGYAAADLAAPVTVARRGAEAGKGQIDYDTFEAEVVKLMEGEGPWGEKQAFVDLRAAMVEDAQAEDARVRASEQQTEARLAELALDD